LPGIGRHRVRVIRRSKGIRRFVGIIDCGNLEHCCHPRNRDLVCSDKVLRKLWTASTETTLATQLAPAKSWWLDVSQVFIRG
jgi:hypothetical protein